MPVSSGSYTVGPTGTYPTWAAAFADVAAALTGTLTFNQAENTVETTSPVLVCNLSGHSLNITAFGHGGIPSSSPGQSIFQSDGMNISVTDTSGSPGSVVISKLNFRTDSTVKPTNFLLSVVTDGIAWAQISNLLLNGNNNTQNVFVLNAPPGGGGHLTLSFVIAWAATFAGFNLTATPDVCVFAECDAVLCARGFFFDADCFGNATNLLAVNNTIDFVILNPDGFPLTNCGSADLTAVGTSCQTLLPLTDVVTFVYTDDSFMRLVAGSTTAISGTGPFTHSVSRDIRGIPRGGTSGSGTPYAMGAVEGYSPATLIADIIGDAPNCTLTLASNFEEASATSERTSLGPWSDTSFVSTVMSALWFNKSGPVVLFPTGLSCSRVFAGGVPQPEIDVPFILGCQFISHVSFGPSIVVTFEVEALSTGFATFEIDVPFIIGSQFKTAYIENPSLAFEMIVDCTFTTDRAPEGTLEADYEATGRRRSFPILVYALTARSEDDLGGVPDNQCFIVAPDYSGITGETFFDQGASPLSVGTKVRREDGVSYVAFRRPLNNEVVWHVPSETLYRFQNTALNGILFQWVIYRPMPQRNIEGQFVFDIFDADQIYPFIGKVAGALQYEYSYDTFVLLDQLNADKAATFYLPALAASFGLSLNYDDPVVVRRSKTRNAVAAFKLKGTPHGVEVWLRALGYKGYANEIWIDPGYPTFRLAQTLSGEAGNVAISTTGARIYAVGFTGGLNLIPAHATISFREQVVPLDGETISIGLIAQAASANMIEYSDSPSHWTGSGVLVTGVTTAPDGITTVTPIIEQGSTTHSVTPNLDLSGISGGDTTTVSVFFKRVVGVRNIRIRVSSSNSLQYYECVYNLDSFTLVPAHGSGGGTVLNARCVPYANGWFRLIVTGIHSASLSLASVAFNLLDATGAVSYTGISDSIALFGAQLEKASDASTPIHTDAAAVARGATTGRDAVVFEFDLDSSVASGHILVPIVYGDIVATLNNFITAFRTAMAGICYITDITSPNIIGPPINDQAASTKPYGCLNPLVNPSNFLEVPHGFFSGPPEVFWPSSRLSIHLNKLDGSPVELTPAIKSRVAKELHLSVLPVHLNIKQFVTNTPVEDDGLGDGIGAGDSLQISERQVVFIRTPDTINPVTTPDGQHLLIGDHEVIV